MGIKMKVIFIYLVLMLAVGFTTGTDNGHTFIGPFTVKDGNNRDLFFKIYYTKDKSNSLSWYNANAHCEGENGYLAKLDSSQANDGIKNTLDEQKTRLPDLSASKGFWIGLIQDRNVRQSSSYYWIDEFNFQSLECTRSTQLPCRREATAGGENTNEESCRKNMCCWTGTECVFPKGKPNIRQDNSCAVEDRFRDACKGNNDNPTTCRADTDCCYQRPNDNQYPTCYYRHSLPGPLGYSDWAIGKGGTDSNDRRCGIQWQDFSWQWDHQKCQSNNGNNVGFICQYPVMPSTISPSTTMEQTTAATTITTQSTTTLPTTIETTQSPMTTTIATTIPIKIVDTTLNDTTTIDTTVAETTIVDTTMVDTTLAETTIVDTTMADTTFADTTMVDTTMSDTTLVDTTIVDTTIDESTEEPSTTPLVTSYSTTRHSVSTSQEFELTTAREIAGTTTARSSAVPPSTTVSIAPSSSVLTSSSTASSTATVASTTSLPSSSTAAAESSTSATQMSSTIDLASIKREREESERAGKIGMWIGIGVGLLVLIVLVILLIAFLTRKKQPVRKPEFAEREDNTYIDDVDPVMLTNPLYEQTQSPRNSKINIEISIGESGQVTTNGMSMPTGKSISSMRLSGCTTNPGYEMMSIRKENDRQSPNQDYEMMGMNGSDKRSTLKSDYSVPRSGSELSGTESEYDTPKVQPDYDTPRYLGRLLPAPPAYSKDKPKDPWDIQVVEGWNAQSKI